MMNRILIIDADQDFLFLITKLLEKHRFDVTCFPTKPGTHEANSWEVAKSISSNKPDIIFLDTFFFNKKEATTCKLIRSMYTGYLVLIGENPKRLSQYNDCNANAFLSKPFTAQTLLKLLI